MTVSYRATNWSLSDASLRPNSAEDSPSSEDSPVAFVLDTVPPRVPSLVSSGSPTCPRNDSGTSSMNSRIRFDLCGLTLGGVRPGSNPAGILAAFMGLRSGSAATSSSAPFAPFATTFTSSSLSSHSARSAADARGSGSGTTPAFTPDTSAASEAASARTTASRRDTNRLRSSVRCSGAKRRFTHAASIRAHRIATRSVFNVSRWSSGSGDTVHSMNVFAPDAINGAKVIVSLESLAPRTALAVMTSRTLESATPSCTSSDPSEAGDLLESSSTTLDNASNCLAAPLRSRSPSTFDLPILSPSPSLTSARPSGLAPTKSHTCSSDTMPLGSLTTTSRTNACALYTKHDVSQSLIAHVKK